MMIIIIILLRVNSVQRHIVRPMGQVIWAYLIACSLSFGWLSWCASWYRTKRAMHNVRMNKPNRSNNNGKKFIITRQLHRCRRHQHPYFIDYDVMFISLRCLFLFHSTLFFEFLKSVRFIVASFWFCARIPITS